MTATTTNKDDGKLDNMTVRRFAKLLKNSKTDTSTPITTGTVVQNDNDLFVAIDDETLVPITDTNSNVQLGDKVTLAIDGTEALIVGNITDQNATSSEVAQAQSDANDSAKVATNYIKPTDDGGIVLGDFSTNEETSNITLECTGTVSQNGTAFSKDGHVHEGAFVKSRFITKEYTIEASEDGAVDFECPTIEGKTPLLICDYETGNSNVYINNLMLYDNHVFIGLKNISSESITEWLRLKLLYIADGWIEEAE